MITEQAQSRYQIVREVGSGSFATVYAARDVKLGRDVALKQIHRQYLGDPVRLARYWQEAQLLASLEHPHIMTIYDVIESRGCLVLELMQGSLKQIYLGRPMLLQDVRQTLFQAAQGLHVLHENGILHGDVKPGNLLLSRQGLVKLGDFGLARRASDSDGSLVKGTTKYMAPEVISDKFGPVGPASDLYSLGFAALELMCGPEFELLFPGLSAFGRDQQMAWMLWHSAADRRLPDLKATLEGLPEDLDKILQKLTAKDQAKRYRSARELLTDLGSGSAGRAIGSAEKEAAAAEEAASQARQKKRRVGAIAAFAASVMLSIAILFFPTEKPAPPPAPPPPQAIEGVVKTIALPDQRFVIAVGDDWKEITLFENDRIVLNRKERQLRDLQPGDRVVIRTLHDPQQRPFQEIVAARPESHRGRIQRVQADEGELILHVEEGEDAGTDLVLQAPPGLAITLNGETRFADQPVTLAMLKPGDRAVVEHSDSERGQTVLSLAVQRIVEMAGYVRDVDTAQSELSLALGEGEQAKLVKLPIASSCEITLNGLRFLNGQVLKPSDIRPGDKVNLRRDVAIVALDAYRAFRQKGSLTRIAYDTRTLDVQLESGGESSVFILAPDCRVTIGGEEAAVTDLRRGDVVELSHDSPGDKTPTVLALDASRPPHPTKWALLIANQTFDDATLAPLSYPLANVRRLRERLTKRYAVPADQTLLLEDESRVRLEQAVPAFLARVPVEGELYVYVVTHAYAQPNDTVYLAPKEFAFSRKSVTGLRLDWLIDQLEACQPRQKLLLLDCCHAPGAADLGQEVSTAEMINLLLQNRRVEFFKTLHVLASCQPGQRGQTAWDDPQYSLFAACLADGFSGAADKEFDNRLEVTELAEYVAKSMAALGSLHGAVQTPKLYVPNNAPPRLSEEAKQAVLRLLAQLNQSKVDPAAFRPEAAEAIRLAKGQPEAQLALGLLLMKAREKDDALQELERVRLEHEKELLAHEAIAWMYFDRRDYAAGTSALLGLIDHLPQPANPGDPPDPVTLATAEWAGRLRELGAAATWLSKPPSAQSLDALDQAVAKRGPPVQARYEAGRQSVRAAIAEFDRKIAEDPASQPRINLQKISLLSYAAFPLEAAAEQIRDAMEK